MPINGGVLAGHTEVHDWYQVNVVPTLRTAKAFNFPATRKDKADLVLVTSIKPTNPVKTGSLLTYTITVTNAGPVVSRGVSVQDTWDSSVKVISATATDAAGHAHAVRLTSTTAIFDVGDLAVDGTVTLTLTVRVPSKPTRIKNSALADSVNPPGSTLPRIAAFEDTSTDIVS
jgi:uncharacterized repeat protein (TIGR01451 family)